MDTRNGNIDTVENFEEKGVPKKFLTELGDLDIKELRKLKSITPENLRIKELAVIRYMKTRKHLKGFQKISVEQAFRNGFDAGKESNESNVNA